MSNENFEVIGVDLGATDTKIARVGADGQLRSDIKIVKTVPEPKEYMKKLKDALADLADDSVKAVGMGIPSWDGQSETIQHSPNMPKFEGLAVGKELEKEEKLKSLKIVIDNDANVAADGERRFGGWPEGTLVVYTLGSGIGGGVILHLKELDRYYKWKGDTFKGAELGHVTIPTPEGRESRICGCGHLNCLESHAAATSIRDIGDKSVLKALTNGKRSLILDKIYNDPKVKPDLLCGDAQELVKYIQPLHVNQAAEEEDEIALEIENQTAQALAYGIRNVVQIFDPVIVVLTGAMRNWKNMVDKAENIYKNMMGVVPAVPIGISKLDNAGIVGSAAMAFDFV
ncbi:ROK family protein [Candidatus Poribacteria bacterium]|nr:ROK family protein [Candidatus Poribacteria bacterium]